MDGFFALLWRSEKAFSGGSVNVFEVARLLSVGGSDADVVRRAADSLRKAQTGDDVTYVVNRNINFTNVCVKRCGFCAFSRDARRSSESYYLPIEEVVRRAKQAKEYGATEVCIQAGLPPHMDGKRRVLVIFFSFERQPSLVPVGCNPEP